MISQEWLSTGKERKSVKMQQTNVPINKLIDLLIFIDI